jgi:hypothetical protein
MDAETSSAWHYGWEVVFLELLNFWPGKLKNLFAL